MASCNSAVFSINFDCIRVYRDHISGYEYLKRHYKVIICNKCIYVNNRIHINESITSPEVTIENGTITIVGAIYLKKLIEGCESCIGGCKVVNEVTYTITNNNVTRTVLPFIPNIASIPNGHILYRDRKYYMCIDVDHTELKAVRLSLTIVNLFNGNEFIASIYHTSDVQHIVVLPNQVEKIVDLVYHTYPVIKFVKEDQQYILMQEYRKPYLMPFKR